MTRTFALELLCDCHAILCSFLFVLCAAIVALIWQRALQRFPGGWIRRRWCRSRTGYFRRRQDRGCDPPDDGCVRLGGCLLPRPRRPALAPAAVNRAVYIYIILEAVLSCTGPELRRGMGAPRSALPSRAACGVRLPPARPVWWQGSSQCAHAARGEGYVSLHITRMPRSVHSIAVASWRTFVSEWIASRIASPLVPFPRTRAVASCTGI